MVAMNESYWNNDRHPFGSDYSYFEFFDSDEDVYDRDEESGDDDDGYDDDSVELLPCPECGAEIYEEAQRCPYCGAYVVHSSGNLFDGRAWWWIVLGVLGIISVVVTLTLAIL